MALYALIIVVGCYFAACFFVFLFQEKFIFFPDSLPNDFLFRFEHPFEENYIKVDTNIKLHSLYFSVDQPKGCVLYHHGNSRNLIDWASNYVDFTSRGYDVLFYDYRGYGKSDGKVASEKQLVQDAEKVYQWLLKEKSPRTIVQYGRSLGSGIAVQLACGENTSSLILETPYYSVLTMARNTLKMLPINWILKYPFLTNEAIREVQCPVFLIHGTNDKLIKKENSEKLEKQNKGTVLFTIKGGSHNNLPGFREYQKTLSSILK